MRAVGCAKGKKAKAIPANETTIPANEKAALENEKAVL